MNKPKNWDSVKPLSEREELPVDGYIVRIVDAKVKTYTSNGKSFDKLEIAFDIANGEYTGYFANDFRSQTFENKKWKGVLRQYTPKDDGSEKDELTKSIFKSMTDAIEESNAGYHWDWNEAGLKGKIVGCIFRNEEWEFNGRSGWKAQPFKFVPAETISSGKFKIPKEKPLKNKSGSSSASSSKATDFEEIVGDDSFPF